MTPAQKEAEAKYQLSMKGKFVWSADSNGKAIMQFDQQDIDKYIADELTIHDDMVA